MTDKLSKNVLHLPLLLINKPHSDISSPPPEESLEISTPEIGHKVFSFETTKNFETSSEPTMFSHQNDEKDSMMSH